MKKINIGITLYWSHERQHIFTNGANQNLYFLAECLRRIPWVKSVYFVGWGQNFEAIPESFSKITDNYRVYEVNEILNTTDVIIEGTLLLSETIAQAFKLAEAKIISFRMGNDYVIAQSDWMFMESNREAFGHVLSDAIWAVPQIEKSNKHYMEIIKGVPMQVVPHLWDETFVKQAIAEYKAAGVEYKGFNYRKPRKSKAYENRVRPKRVVIMEPNIMMNKSCYTPILIAEAAYRFEPDAIGHVYLTNVMDRIELPVFKEFIGRTTLIRDGVMSVEPTYQTPWFLGNYADVLVCHQWELGLNYLYYEALYGNYPLVHNSPFLRDAGLGYYYEDMDAYDGAASLLEAIESYDENIEEHKIRNKAYLKTQSPKNKDNIKIFESLLKDLVNDENA